MLQWLNPMQRARNSCSCIKSNWIPCVSDNSGSPAICKEGYKDTTWVTLPTANWTTQELLRKPPLERQHGLTRGWLCDTLNIEQVYEQSPKEVL